VKEKIVQLNKKFFLSFFIILFCFALDRVTKFNVINLYTNTNFKDQYINSYTNLTLIWNKGIAFGLFESETLFYSFISFFIFLIIIFIMYLILKSKILSEVFFLSVVAGGALGNFFDRLYYNAVPDFIDLHYKNFHWFTFNVADICISIGIVMLLLFDILKIKFKNNE